MVHFLSLPPPSTQEVSESLFSVNFHCVYKFETWVFKNLFFLVDFFKIAKIVQRIPTYPVFPNVYIFPNVQ